MALNRRQDGADGPRFRHSAHSTAPLATFQATFGKPSRNPTKLASRTAALADHHHIASGHGDLPVRLAGSILHTSAEFGRLQPVCRRTRWPPRLTTIGNRHADVWRSGARSTSITIDGTNNTLQGIVAGHQ